jgi:hypothetical protein
VNDLSVLNSSALLGTERNPLGKLEDAHLENVRQALAGDAAAQLLGVAALACSMAKSGQSAAAAQALPPAAITETKPMLPQAAQARWQHLHSNDTGLILEWLELVGQHGYVVLHRDIISLLDYGRQNTHQRAVIQPLLGARGRWMAQQNPYWAWAMGDTSSEENNLEVWETGNQAARALALAAMRAANPERARSLLQAVWKSEAAIERKTFLAELEKHLSPADEPFLETCLDDRSKDVRAIAAGLLAKLPDSALVGRMKARAAKLLVVGKKELEVVLPEWEDGFLRDGLEKKSPLYNVGEKAYWWQTIVSRVPLGFWQTHLGLEPKEILKQLPKGWKENFINAVLEQPITATWAEAIFEYNKKLLEDTRVMLSLPQAKREEMIATHLFAASTSVYWIDAVRHTWSIEFSHAVRQRLIFVSRQLITGTKQYFHCSGFAPYIHPSLLETWHLEAEFQQAIARLVQFKNGKKETNSYVEHFLGDLETLIFTLDTRIQMRKELLL